MQMQWKILQPDRNLVRHIQKSLQCHSLTATVLANRLITSADEASEFIRPTLDMLPAPDLLTGMSAAVDRIVRAIRDKEKILVFGDYDADGVTATAVLVHFLKAAGAQVLFHLPHRIDEGYGLQAMHIVQLAVPQHAGLIVTVDCGSSSADAVAAARRFGIDVIVTDHHNLGDQVPDHCDLINPKQDGQTARLADLAGVGVAFYFVIALRTALRAVGWWQDRPEPNLKAYCDLVAIGTIADMVSLKGVNRVLIRAGLDQINTCPRPGIQALLKASGIRHCPVTADDIAFRLAPRINAAGRMAHARLAFDLLCAPNVEAARPLAEDLHILNQRRQDMENHILAEIIARLDSRPDMLCRRSLVVAGSNWHQGVLGIVAAKLVARFHRPVIVLSAGPDAAKGSGRSVPQVDLYAALGDCAHLLDKYGGHRMAAGLSIRTEYIGKLQHAFEESVTKMLDCENIIPQLEIDSEIELGQICPQLIDELESLAPFGTGNPPPLFVARDVRVTTAAMVAQRHRRMALCQPHQCTPPIAAIQFNIAPDTPRAEAYERIAFRLQWNRYQNDKKIQIIVEAC